MDMSLFKKRGFYIALFVTFLGSYLGTYLSTFPYLQVIGALVLALLFGMLLQFLKPLHTECKVGTGFIANKFLRLGIILLGFKLNLVVLLEAGIQTLLLAACVVAGMIFFCSLLCRAFKVDNKLALLASCGCGICGAAAVMGVSPQLKAEEDDSVLSVAVVAILGTLFTIVEVILFPMLGLSPTQFGVAAGASLHEIAHAVAAGGAGGAQALDIAIIMKLSRVLMLIPVALIIGFIAARKEGSSSGKIPIPWFMFGFLAASCAGSYLSIPQELLAFLIQLAYICLGMAMVALGMNVHFKVIAERGGRVFAACFIASAVLMLFSIGAAKLFF